jgi:hypothetical protein
MHKLAPLVEKGGVVLVALDDKTNSLSVNARLPKVVRNAANKITWIAAAVLEDPREKGRRRGFSMGARDDQRAFLPRMKNSFNSSGSEQ